MDTEKHLLYQEVGKRIRSTRERSSPKISQAQLAMRLNVSRASIVNIEAGRQCAPLHLLWQIAEVLGTEATLLVPRRDELLAVQRPIKLDDDTIAQIEAAANGDMEARRRLINFVSNAKSSFHFVATPESLTEEHHETKN